MQSHALQVPTVKRQWRVVVPQICGVCQTCTSTLFLSPQGMGERVHELLRLNAALVDSNQQLQHRLIQAALGDDESDVPATARAASAENDALARRYSELQHSLAAEEERRRDAFTRRLKLQTKGQRLVEAAAKGAPQGAGPEEAAAIKAREVQRREEREVARLALQVRGVW